MEYNGSQYDRASMRGSSLFGPTISELPGSPGPISASSEPWKYNPRPSPRRQEKYIAIGIDFGTTYSGVSWAFSGDPEAINEVSRWPCRERRGQDEVQIPTQIDLATRDWGYLIPKNCDPIRWFKLLLLDSNDTQDDIKNSPQLQAARQQLQRHAGFQSDGVVDLIAEFLKHLWTHALKEIKREIEVEVLPLKVALTVPAIWPPYAREKMKEAARKAGILDHRPIGKTTLALVEEPEAAAMCTLFDRRNYPEIGVGETFIVCDCGGGTVDIISYTVVSTDPFRIGEAVTGAGKLCGAFLVDQAFENYMTKKSGLKFDKCEANDFRVFVNDEWEYTMKRTFDGEEQQSTFAIRPPAKTFGTVKRIKGSNDSFRLNKDVIKQFYAKTYYGTRDLVSQQQEKIKAAKGKAPKKVLLVGGLGASPYIYAMLQAQYENVLQPRRAWSAVARGAVITVLKGAFDPDPAGADAKTRATLSAMPSIVSRVARFSYGVVLGQPIASVSPPADRSKDEIYTEVTGEERVKRITWYLLQGESVDNKDPIVYGFYKYLSHRNDMKSALRIYTSDADTPPCRMDSSVKTLCTIRYEIGMPWEDLPQRRDSSGRIHRLADNMQLTMKVDGEPKWALKAGGNTVEQDVNVEYMGGST